MQEGVQDPGPARPGDSGAELTGGERGGRRQSRQLASLSIADVSPRLATQRIMALFGRGEHREAAAFLRRISVTTFRQLVTQLPTSHFVDCLPQSLPLLEVRPHISSNGSDPIGLCFVPCSIVYIIYWVCGCVPPTWVGVCCLTLMFPPGPVLQAVPLRGGQEALLRPLRVPRDRGLAARQVLRPPGGPEPRQQGGKVRIDSYSRH